MKIQILCAVLIAGTLSAAARAADDDASHDLQNLVYYPHAGEFRALGSFTGSLQDSGQTTNDLGVETTSRSTSYERATAGLSAGLPEGWRVGVNETALFQQNNATTNQSNGVVSNTTSKGLSDPTLTVANRLIDAHDEGFSLDASFNVTPQLGHALSAQTGQTGNDISDSWAAGAAVTGYYRFYLGPDHFANELMVEPTVTREFGGVASGTSLAASTLTSSYWSGAVDIADRFHIDRRWFIQPGVGLEMPYTYYTSNQAGGPDTQHTTQFYAAPTGTIGFLPMKDLLLEAIVTYISNTSNAAPATGASTSSQGAQTYAEFQVLYAFGGPR